MIKPTIGRIVWYSPGDDTGMQYDGTQPLASIICYVWPDDTVNLTVHDADGHSIPKISVPVFQGNAEDCPPGSCCWMPYQQKKQAEESAKEEAEETTG